MCKSTLSLKQGHVRLLFCFRLAIYTVTLLMMIRI